MVVLDDLIMKKNTIYFYNGVWCCWAINYWLKIKIAKKIGWDKIMRYFECKFKDTFSLRSVVQHFDVFNKWKGIDESTILKRVVWQLSVWMAWMGVKLKVRFLFKRLAPQPLAMNNQCHNFDTGYLNRMEVLCEMTESGNLLDTEIKEGWNVNQYA